MFTNVRRNAYLKADYSTQGIREANTKMKNSDVLFDMMRNTLEPYATKSQTGNEYMKTLVMNIYDFHMKNKQDDGLANLVNNAIDKLIRNIKLDDIRKFLRDEVKAELKDKDTKDILDEALVKFIHEAIHRGVKSASDPALRSYSELLTAFAGSNNSGKSFAHREGETRKYMEVVDPSVQCDTAMDLLPEIIKKTCWICQQKLHTKPSPQCEHMFPLLDAFRFSTVQRQGRTEFKSLNIAKKRIYELEYRWSHECCNQLKGNIGLVQHNKGNNTYSLHKDNARGLLNLIAERMAIKKKGSSMKGLYDCEQILEGKSLDQQKAIIANLPSDTFLDSMEKILAPVFACMNARSKLIDETIPSVLVDMKVKINDSIAVLAVLVNFMSDKGQALFGAILNFYNWQRKPDEVKTDVIKKVAAKRKRKNLNEGENGESNELVPKKSAVSMDGGVIEFSDINMPVYKLELFSKNDIVEFAKDSSHLFLIAACISVLPYDMINDTMIINDDPHDEYDILIKMNEIFNTLIEGNIHIKIYESNESKAEKLENAEKLWKDTIINTYKRYSNEVERILPQRGGWEVNDEIQFAKSAVKTIEDMYSNNSLNHESKQDTMETINEELKRIYKKYINPVVLSNINTILHNLYHKTINSVQHLGEITGAEIDAKQKLLQDYTLSPYEIAEQQRQETITNNRIRTNRLAKLEHNMNNYAKYGSTWTELYYPFGYSALEKKIAENLYRRNVQRFDPLNNAQYYAAKRIMKIRELERPRRNAEAARYAAQEAEYMSNEAVAKRAAAAATQKAAEQKAAEQRADQARVLDEKRKEKLAELKKYFDIIMADDSKIFKMIYGYQPIINSLTEVLGEEFDPLIKSHYDSVIISAERMLKKREKERGAAAEAAAAKAAAEEAAAEPQRRRNEETRRKKLVNNTARNTVRRERFSNLENNIRNYKTHESSWFDILGRTKLEKKIGEQLGKNPVKLDLAINEQFDAAKNILQRSKDLRKQKIESNRINAEALTKAAAEKAATAVAEAAQQEAEAEERFKRFYSTAGERVRNRIDMIISRPPAIPHMPYYSWEIEFAKEQEASRKWRETHQTPTSSSSATSAAESGAGSFFSGLSSFFSGPRKAASSSAEILPVATSSATSASAPGLGSLFSGFGSLFSGSTKAASSSAVSSGIDGTEAAVHRPLLNSSSNSSTRRNPSSNIPAAVQRRQQQQPQQSQQQQQLQGSSPFSSRSVPAAVLGTPVLGTPVAAPITAPVVIPTATVAVSRTPAAQPAITFGSHLPPHWAYQPTAAGLAAAAAQINQERAVADAAAPAEILKKQKSFEALKVKEQRQAAAERKAAITRTERAAAAQGIYINPAQPVGEVGHVHGLSVPLTRTSQAPHAVDSLRPVSLTPPASQAGLVGDVYNITAAQPAGLLPRPQETLLVPKLYSLSFPPAGQPAAQHSPPPPPLLHSSSVATQHLSHPLPGLNPSPAPWTSAASPIYPAFAAFAANAPSPTNEWVQRMRKPLFGGGKRKTKRAHHKKKGLSSRRNRVGRIKHGIGRRHGTQRGHRGLNVSRIGRKKSIR